jgi:RNA polymerase sigma factor (sigma-70 family)
VRAIGRANPMQAQAIRAPFARRLRLGRLDDGRLAALAGTGDERAFEALYERHHLALLGFCRHLLGSREEGEDALQQTFMRAHRSLVDHGAPDDVRPWLFAIARNRCRTIAAARRTVAVPPDELEPATEGLSPEVERRADLRALLADLHRLPEDQRAALVLGEVADLTHAEIGAVIGVPAAKVKALVFQARSFLIAEREARETPCAQIREQLATARGAELRRGPLRRHLRGCEPCRAYGAAVGEQRKALGLLLPVLPSAGLKATVLGAIGGGGAGGAAVTVGGAGGAAGLGAKLAIGAALIGGAGSGAVLVEESVRNADKPHPSTAEAIARAAAPATGGGPGATIFVTEDDAGPAGTRGSSQEAQARAEAAKRARKAAKRAQKGELRGNKTRTRTRAGKRKALGHAKRGRQPRERRGAKLGIPPRATPPTARPQGPPATVPRALAPRFAKPPVVKLPRVRTPTPKPPVVAPKVVKVPKSDLLP